MNTETIPPSITSAHLLNTPVTCIVVGAGGTGGRLIPALTQVLRRGDKLIIIDGDHVEDRNLARQNFRTRDIGLNKAEVMMRRYRREGIETIAYATMLTMGLKDEIFSRTDNRNYIMLGCVDNTRARIDMDKLCNECSCAWIDAGNERRGGQVILSTNYWPTEVKYQGHQASGRFRLLGMNAMPQLITIHPWHCDRCNIDNTPEQSRCPQCQQPEGSCRDRIDLQTVAVNQLSASCMLNIVSCLLYGVPMMSCGAFFSTLNTMSPIKLNSVRWSRSEVFPETTYAS